MYWRSSAQHPVARHILPDLFASTATGTASSMPGRRASLEPGPAYCLRAISLVTISTSRGTLPCSTP